MSKCSRALRMILSPLKGNAFSVQSYRNSLHSQPVLMRRPYVSLYITAPTIYIAAPANINKPILEAAHARIILRRLKPHGSVVSIIII